MITLLSVHRLNSGHHLTLNLADNSLLTATLQKVSNEKPAELVLVLKDIDQHDINPTGRACGAIMQAAYGSAQHDSKEWSSIWKAMSRYQLPGGQPMPGGPAPAPPTVAAPKAKAPSEDEGGGLF